MPRFRLAALRGLAPLFFIAGSAAVVPAAHAQSGTLSYSGATSCTSFTGWTWNGTQLTVNCATATTPTPPPPPLPPTCDTTTPGAFTFAPATATVARGGSTTLQVQRTGGCGGAYTITFGNNLASATPGSTLSPATSVSFAAGDAAPKTITFNAASTAGTAAIWLSGYQSSSIAPPISGTVTVTVQ